MPNDRQSGPEFELRLRGITKTFATDSGAHVRALARVDADLRKGEFATLIGPTGCGKTTLLNIAAGLCAPDAGTLERAEGLRPGRNIPCVFQHYTLFPWRTILGNVAFGLEMRREPKRMRTEAARRLLAQVGLEGFEDARPHELSGGMRQRAAIAQALAIGPRLLLMDEPFGALDDATRRDLQRMVVGLWKRAGITVLFVTHSINEAVLLGDRVLVMCGRPGRIIQRFRVGLSRPRDPRSPEFAQLFMRVRAAFPRGEGAPEG